MHASLDVLSAREFPPDWPPHHHPHPVDASQPGAWSEAWLAGSATCVGLLGEGALPLTALDGILSANAGALGRDERFVASWPVAAAPELPDPWHEFPPQLAVLCVPPLWQQGAVFRRSAVARLGGLPEPRNRPGTELFWHLTWELLHAGGVCNLLPRQELARVPAATLPPLIPTPIPAGRDWLRRALQQELPQIARQLPGAACDRAALQAGVWLIQGEFDESHRLSQEHEGQGRHQLCDQWHAIQHRREPDYGNARYWVRQLPESPHFGELAEIVGRWLENAVPAKVAAWRPRLLGPGGWKPLGQVDLAQAAVGEPTLEQFARRVQWAEMLLLLRQTWRACQSHPV